MSSQNASMLTKNWRDMYEKFKVHRRVSRFSNNERHKIYNNLLLKYLLECQNNQYLPSKDKLETVAVKLTDESDQIISLNGADPSRTSIIHIDNALSEMTFAPIITDHDESGDLNCYYLIVFGIVSIKGLTKSEQELIEDCFGEDVEFDESFDALKVKLMRVPVSVKIDENKQDKINAYCLRVSRYMLAKYAVNNNLESTGFKYSWFQKIKDKLLDGSI